MHQSRGRAKPHFKENKIKIKIGLEREKNRSHVHVLRHRASGEVRTAVKAVLLEQMNDAIASAHGDLLDLLDAARVNGFSLLHLLSFFL